MKFILLPLLLLGGMAAAADTELLIQLGLNDKETTVWDGSITVTPHACGGQCEGPWQQPEEDRRDGETAWPYF